MSRNNPDAAPVLRPLISPAAWRAVEMKDASRWTRLLTRDEIADLDRVVASAKARGAEIIDLRRADVDLPVLGPTLARLREDLIHGRGFALLRGMPIERMSRWEIMVAYWALGLHLGEPVSQNAKGHLIGHVKDIGHDYRTNTSHRAYQTHLEITPHTDSCDIVGLLCLHGAQSGGLNTVASSAAIYNAMIERCPELALELSQPVYFDRRGEVPEGKKPWYQLAIFNRYDDYLTALYAPRYLYIVTRHPEVPPLTEQRKAAYAMLDQLAVDDEFRLDMDFRPGDVQLVFNHVILHSRTQYVDHEDPAKKRHLLRLWLSAPDARPLPASFEERYGPIEPGRRRGGIRVPGARENIPMEAE